MSIPWFRVAPIAEFVPRGIGSQIEFAGHNHEAAPDHFEFESNILNTRPAGRWPRLTVTFLDARLTSSTLPSPGQTPSIAAVEVDVLVSVSNPDPVWSDKTNGLSVRLLGFALGYLDAHPTKAWALTGGGGGPNVVIEWTLERSPYDQALMNSTFQAAQVPLMPALAYTVRVVQKSPSGVVPAWPEKWTSPRGTVVGAEGLAAAEALAAAHKAPLVWADELVGDAAALVALRADGWVVAIHDGALLVDDKVDRARVNSIPPGVLVVGHVDRAKALNRAGLPTLTP